MDYKEETKRVYNKFACEFEERTKDYLSNYIFDDAELFIKNLKGKNILDLGSGPGRDALFFKQKGLFPTCVDISSEMVNLCKQKGLNAFEMDIENILFNNGSFDWVWAYTSLLHITKEQFPVALKKISDILNDNGIFYLGMKEGDSEGWLASDKYGNENRFFALYRDNELKTLLSQFFIVIHSSQVKIGEAHFLNYLCTKR